MPGPRRDPSPRAREALAALRAAAADLPAHEAAGDPDAAAPHAVASSDTEAGAPSMTGDRRPDDAATTPDVER